jgi:chromosome segregation and condensation protein ScpB
LAQVGEAAARLEEARRRRRGRDRPSAPSHSQEVVEPVAMVTAEQLEVVAVVALLGTPTRRQIEKFRCQDTEWPLRRLVERGLLEKGRDDAAPGGPSIYRVTAAALAAIGQPSVEALRASLTERMAGGEA